MKNCIVGVVLTRPILNIPSLTLFLSALRNSPVATQHHKMTSDKFGVINTEEMCEEDWSKLPHTVYWLLKHVPNEVGIIYPKQKI